MKKVAQGSGNKVWEAWGEVSPWWTLKSLLSSVL